jgi:hypothetical protein
MVRGYAVLCQTARLLSAGSLVRSTCKGAGQYLAIPKIWGMAGKQYDSHDRRRHFFVSLAAELAVIDTSLCTGAPATICRVTCCMRVGNTPAHWGLVSEVRSTSVSSVKDFMVIRPDGPTEPSRNVDC